MRIKLPDKVYDALKWICLIVLPASSTLYCTLAYYWGWPYSEAIPGTIAAVATFFGAIIGISTINYNNEN